MAEICKHEARLNKKALMYQNAQRHDTWSVRAGKNEVRTCLDGTCEDELTSTDQRSDSSRNTPGGTNESTVFATIDQRNNVGDLAIETRGKYGATLQCSALGANRAC